MYLFDKRYAEGRFGYPLLLIESVVTTVLGISMGFLLFPEEAGLVGVFLIALSQGRTVNVLLERNRSEIWEGRSTPGAANFKLAKCLFVIFIGILLTYAMATLFVPDAGLDKLFERQIGDYAGQSVDGMVFSDVGDILGHNMIVLLACFLFSLLYRHGGMLFILAWNASVWGVVFSYLARSAPDITKAGSIFFATKFFLSIFPHLLLEALAYIFIAMAGVFVSKALQKYEPGSTKFNQVSIAAIKIALLSILTLIAAGGLESALTPVLIDLMF